MHEIRSMPARAIGSASISFGLVAIPVEVYSTTESSHEVHFHRIHKGCGERVKQVHECPTHGVVARDDLTRGYQVGRGAHATMVELSADEVDALDAVADNTIAITEFVPASAIDPIYVDRTYYLGPGKGAAHAYRLLRDALEDAELVGVARYAARGKAYVVTLRPYETGLAMHQLRYPEDVKDWSTVDLPSLPAPAASELALAKQVIAHLRHDTFDPSQYRDDVTVRIEELLAKKAKHGEAIVAPETAPAPKVTDLMAALRASLGQAPGHGRAQAHHRPKRRAAASRR